MKNIIRFFENNRHKGTSLNSFMIFVKDTLWYLKNIVSLLIINKKSEKFKRVNLDYKNLIHDIKRDLFFIEKLDDKKIPSEKKEIRLFAVVRNSEKKNTFFTRLL